MLNEVDCVVVNIDIVSLENRSIMQVLEVEVVKVEQLKLVMKRRKYMLGNKVRVEVEVEVEGSSCEIDLDRK